MEANTESAITDKDGGVRAQIAARWRDDPKGLLLVCAGGIVFVLNALVYQRTSTGLTVVVVLLCLLLIATGFGTMARAYGDGRAQSGFKWIGLVVLSLVIGSLGLAFLLFPAVLLLVPLFLLFVLAGVSEQDAYVWALVVLLPLVAYASVWVTVVPALAYNRRRRKQSVATGAPNLFGMVLVCLANAIDFRQIAYILGIAGAAVALLEESPFGTAVKGLPVMQAVVLFLLIDQYLSMFKPEWLEAMRGMQEQKISTLVIQEAGTSVASEPEETDEEAGPVAS